MAHYPSREELAAFRQTIPVEEAVANRILNGRLIPDALPGEISGGIGFRIGRRPSPEWNEDPMPSRHFLARSRAARLRRSAFVKVDADEPWTEADANAFAPIR